MNEVSADPDSALVARAQSGDRAALDSLAKQHCGWIYNLALKMLWEPAEAADAAQQVLLKLVTKISTFEHKSAFRTWLYRLVVNEVLTRKKGRVEAHSVSFEEYGENLDRAPDLELAGYADAERRLLVEEAKVGCMTGMLLCLDRDQRIVYVLGSIFEVGDAVGAEVLGVSKEAFRKRLSRARADLHHFMDAKCGLVNLANPCRCAHKTKAFIDAGYVDPDRLKFTAPHVSRIKDVAAREAESVFTAATASYPELFRDHPFQDSGDVLFALRTSLAGTPLAGLFDDRA